MDGPRDDHTKSSQSDGETQISRDITHMWKSERTAQLSLFTNQRQTHRYRKHTYGYQRGEGNDKLGAWG